MIISQRFTVIIITVQKFSLPYVLLFTGLWCPMWTFY